MSTSNRRRRTIVASLPFAFVAACITGVSLASAESNDEIETSVSSAGAPVSYAAGTRTRGIVVKPEDADAQTTRALDEVGVKHIAETPGGAITVDLAHPGDEITNRWRADLAAGAYAELTRTDQAAYSERVTAATATGPDESGRTVSTPLGIGAARLGQEFGSPDDTELRARVTKIADQFGITLRDLQILHPLESAIDVSFEVDDDMKIDWTIDRLRGTPRRADRPGRDQGRAHIDIGQAVAPHRRSLPGRRRQPLVRRRPGRTVRCCPRARPLGLSRTRRGRRPTRSLPAPRPPRSP